MTLRRALPAITAITLAITLAWVPAAAMAQPEIDLTVEPELDCDVATFQVSGSGGASPYKLTWDFGDGESETQDPVSAFPVELQHQYPAAGEYAWSLLVNDDGDLTAETAGSLIVEGPAVSLTSEPFPPLLYLQDGQASVELTAEATDGEPPYEYAWELGGAGELVLGADPDTASATFSEAGKYQAMVVVTDACGLTGAATLSVVVIDPDSEACHPMAQRIADAVNTLFPDQAEDLYTCEDIYGFFNGNLIGSQLGFGRMWHAYHLSQTIEELTWEEIRDWHLDGYGWGGLVQLNRFAEALDQVGMRELFELVVSGEASVQDLRHSMHAVLRYGAEFDDALSRLGEGMSPGELGRFYRTAQELGLDGQALDAYLADGLSLQELAHSARVAQRSGADWEEIADAHAAGYSWGAIGQAMRLAEDGDWTSVLEVGVRETRQQLREQDRQERQQARDQRTAERLAAQYGTSVEQVLSLFEGQCSNDWKCVRAELRGEAGSRGKGPKPRD